MKVYTDADKSDTKQYSSSHENVITKSNENGQDESSDEYSEDYVESIKESAKSEKDIKSDDK